MRRSIGTRLLLTFVALATVPLLLVGLVLSWASFTTQQQQALHDEQLKATAVGSRVSAFISNWENELQMSIQVRGLTDLSYEQQQSLLTEVLTYETGFESLALLNTKGQELVRVTRTSVVSQADLVDRSKADEFLSPMSTGKIYYSSVHVDSNTSEPFMTVAVPISNARTGQSAGVLVAQVRFKPIWDLVARTNTGDKDTIYILDADGQVVAHPDSSIVLRGTHFDLTVHNGVQPGLSGTSVILSIDKIQLGEQQFTVVAEQAATDALAFAVNAVLVTAIVILIALAVAVGAGIVSIRLIVRPIRSLAVTAQAIMAGDLTRQAEVLTQDEIGGLATAFNSMTAQLRKTLEGLRKNVSDLENTRLELQVANTALRESEASLERRVHDRTRDLEVAADVSRQVTTMLDLNDLLQVVVERTKAAFGLYHASIFLYNAASNNLMLQAGAGKAGEAMKAQGWNFELTAHGLVPESAQRRAAVVANDTSAEAEFRVNPYLPETHSELALPMFVGDKLVGVLDLQSEHLNRFSADDVRVMTTLAEQIAIAVNNAHLFEEARAARSEAERANEVKSAFLASMSHELRTPLNAIINFTQFILDGDTGPVNDEQKDLLTEVIRSSKHLLNLINDVLDMSKIESGSLKLFVQDNVDVLGLLERVVTTGRSLLNDKDVHIETVFAPDLPPIRGDQQRILQILLNIMSNACKFTETGEIRVSAEHKNEDLVVAIADSGPGIAPEDQALVFEPFKQTRTGLRQAGGTGLGMPIARNLAEAHGGRLWLESKPGDGATFYVSLPVKSEALVPAL